MADAPNAIGENLRLVASGYESAMDIIEHLPIGVLWIETTDCRIGYANKRAREVLTRIDGNHVLIGDEIVGQTADALLASKPDLLAGLNDPTHPPCSEQVKFHADILEVTLAHIFDRSDRHCGALISLRSVTKKLDRAKQLERQNERLERALKTERELVSLQRDFVSMVSHEFRTPLAIVDASVQRLIRRDITEERVTSCVAKIRQAVARLTELVESTLSAAQVESGAIIMNLEECDVAEVLRRACSEQQESTPEGAIDLDCDALPKLIKADPNLLLQIFSNLLSNAVKYSGGDKKVWVRGWSEPGRVIISVRDQGVGIPAAELPRLFEQFFRASTSVGIPGTGIGLTLILYLVELHGGTIDVDSKVGEGTTFTLRLPDRMSAANDQLFTELMATKAADL